MDEVERVEVGEQANPLPTYIKARDEGKLPLKWLTPGAKKSLGWHNV